MLACFLSAWPGAPVEARGGYANWVKHGDSYRVRGAIGGYRGAISVHVRWRGNRFVVQTPLGTYPLKRAGGGVSFRVYFEKAWATVTWVRTRATVVFKGERVVAAVQKLQRRQSGKSGQFRNNRLK